MEVNGIDVSELVDESVQKFIPTVAGRIAHIDADFIAYQVAYKTDHTLEEMIHNLEVNVETQKNLCGAEHYVLHLTASGSTKSGRYAVASLKEYQAQRADKQKPEMLEAIRVYMRDNMNARYWKDREADDGMAQENYLAVKKGISHLSVIVSADKDLRMVPGWHLDPETYCLKNVEGFGELSIIEKSSKKLIGWGHKFFWAQMLMGDTADNISGLPAVCPPVLNIVKPTTKTLMDEQKAAGGCPKAAARLAERKPAQCGPMMAYDLLNSCKSNKEAFKVVYGLYKLYHEQVGFKHWKTCEPISLKRAFLSEGILLWMQRVHDPKDFLNFLKEECI